MGVGCLWNSADIEFHVFSYIRKFRMLYGTSQNFGELCGIACFGIQQNSAEFRILPTRKFVAKSGQPEKTDRTGQPEQDSRNRTARTGQPEQDSQNRTARTGQSEQKRPERTARTDGQKRTEITGQPDQDSYFRTSRTGQPEQENQNRTGSKRHVKQGDQDRTVRTGQL
jgi:hypothetical protein